ncbi:hypothetical protein LTR27_010224 [Elasticomyces elasticus]|nr:hypothetical protein LTR27_010224 [Elasticomyces elasticus]
MDPDPCNWQPADVQQWFRTGAVAAISDGRLHNYHNLSHFFNKLAGNDVDRASLLDSTVDKESLRDEFGSKLMREGARQFSASVVPAPAPTNGALVSISGAASTRCKTSTQAP